MTMDKSLRVRRGMLRNRSVLTRAERITQLQQSERWTPGDDPFHLAKVRVYKLAVKKKKKKKEEEGDAATGAAAATPAAAAAPAAKAAAPAKGAAAPAKKK